MQPLRYAPWPAFGLLLVFGAAVVASSGCERCGAGETRSGGECVRVCNSNMNCTGEEECVDGLCVPRTANGGSSGSASARASSSAPQSSSQAMGSSSAGAPASSVSLRSSSAPVPSSASVSSSSTASESSSAMPSSSSSAAVPVHHLAFVNGPFSVVAGTCSPQLLIETRDAFALPAVPDAPLTISVADPDGSLVLYSDAACTTTVNALTLDGSARTSLYFSSIFAGRHTIRAQAPAVGQTTQDETVAAAAADHLEFTTPEQTVMAGACSDTVTLRAVDVFDNEASLELPVPLTPGSDTGDAVFFDPGCSSAASLLMMLEGSSQVDFSFRARRGGPVELQVDADVFPRAAQRHDVIGAVRRGTCSVAINATDVDCVFTPAVSTTSRSVIFFQTSSSANEPGQATVLCDLAATDRVHCSRDGVGTSADIAFQVAEFPPESGVQVQRVSGNCTDSVLDLPRAVDTGASFVLLSTSRTGTTLGFNDFLAATLSSPTTVQLTPNTCGGGVNLVQVVEMPGARVLRGTGTMATNALSVAVSGLPAVDVTRTFLLYTWRTSSTGASICDRMLRGEIASSTSVAFSRGHGNAQCRSAAIEAFSYERVELPEGSSVQTYAVAMAPSISDVMVPVSALTDFTRTVVFGGGQALSGQSLGEGDYQTDDVPGAFSGLHFIQDAQFTVERGTSGGNAKWSSFVVELGL